MPPGTYLEKRRLMAGYSLSSLARDLLLLTGFGGGGSFGRAESDFRRLRMLLINAEQGSLHLNRDRIEAVRAFVPLDVSLYLHLVECDRSGDPYRIAGLCRLCACSFQDPCVLHVGPTAALGTSVCTSSGTEVCSACEQALARLTPERPTTIAQQLRALSEQIARLNSHAHAHVREPIRLVPTNGER